MAECPRNETRKSKFETRKRRCCDPLEPSFDFRISVFGSRNRQSAISPSADGAIVASLLAHLRVVAHFHSLHQEQNIFGNVGGMISEAL